MLFIILLALTTAIIAASAAFFSVYGMAHIYAAAAIPIMIMGGALEVGKLMAASFLYRHWRELGKLIKIYLFGAIIVLMSITSLGIFGYLTAAYQTDSIPLKQIQQTIDDDTVEKTRLLTRNDDINKEIASLKNNIVNGRIRLQQERQPEIDKNTDRIKELEKEITDLNVKKLNTEAHVGPIIFVAKALGREPDEAVFWFTLLIMSVFDPLAVALTLATNIAIKHTKDKKETSKLLHHLPTEEPIGRKLEGSFKFEPAEELKKQHGFGSAKDRDANIEDLTANLTAEIKKLREEPALTPEPTSPPPTPVTVTVTETVEKTIEKTVEVEKGNSVEERRRALLAAARK